MTLATVDSENRADARIVLLKGLEEGQFIFFTNYNSAKGKDITNNPNVCLVFFWKELERQVRIHGTATRIPAKDSDEYFNSRPEASQVGAWASPQSQTIPDRDSLQQNYSRYEQEYAGKKVPRPEHWGGYAVKPASIEFWQGRSSRMHDMILFTTDKTGQWTKSRLAP